MRALSSCNPILGFSLFLLFLTSCAEEKALIPQEYRGGALGTSYSMKVYSEDGDDLIPSIDSVFQVVNQSMSTYVPDSDISRINRGDTTVVVDAMFREVFEESVRVFKATDGHFDPTVGILVDAWGFGPGAEQEMDSSRVDSLLRYVGLEKVKLTSEGRIEKEFPEVRLDFNAIAKGYAIDRLAAMLDEKGIEYYLVEVGGEVRTKGVNPEKDQPWSIGIDDPQASQGRAIKQIIEIEDAAMASSGNYRKFRVDPETGEKFVHTIDPHTGFTRNSNVLAVSILAPDCMRADAYATACMAMELADSRVLLEEDPDLEGYIIYLDASGRPQEYFTPGFKKVLR